MSETAIWITDVSNCESQLAAIKGLRAAAFELGALYSNWTLTACKSLYDAVSSGEPKELGRYTDDALAEACVRELQVAQIGHERLPVGEQPQQVSQSPQPVESAEDFNPTIEQFQAALTLLAGTNGDVSRALGVAKNLASIFEEDSPEHDFIAVCVIFLQTFPPPPLPPWMVEAMQGQGQPE